MNGDEMLVGDEYISVKKESYRGIMTGTVNISLNPLDTVTLRINE